MRSSSSSFLLPFFFLVFFTNTLFVVDVKSQSVNIFDPRVFNWQFYVQANSDLLQNNIADPQAAQNHWQTFGISEGRQAISTFHTLQYEELYPDINSTFGTDYLGVIGHYLTYGISEGRIGYLPQGGFGRWTVSNGVIALSGSERMGGGFDSVIFNSVEFIDAWDHGRELQLAVTVNYTLGECYNPTQCGSANDGLEMTSTSILNSIQTFPSENRIFSSIEPAFWLAPGQPENNPSAGCQYGLNTVLTSSYTMESNVTVGYLNPNTIQFLSNVYIADDCTMVQTESPTGYMPAQFNTYYTINVTSGALTPFSNYPFAEQGLPLVFATSDGTLAMGAWTPSLPDPNFPNSGYGSFDFSSLQPAADSTNKWTVVVRKTNIPAGTWLSYETYIVVGALEDVTTILPAVVSKVTQLNASTSTSSSSQNN